MTREILQCLRLGDIWYTIGHTMMKIVGMNNI